MSNSVPKHSLQDITFLGSFPNVTKAPISELPEYAFIGRSNVGKSSLINYLCDRKKIAKISSTPGKTQLINLFNVDNRWVLADLPGYGYARISKKIKNKFGAMIENYLLHRENLVTAFLLLDIRHDPQVLDIERMQWLGEKAIPFSLIFTKADKIKPAAVQERVRRYTEILTSYFDDLPNYFVTSTSARLGREDVLDYINYIAEQL